MYIFIFCYYSISAVNIGNRKRGLVLIVKMRVINLAASVCDCVAAVDFLMPQNVKIPLFKMPFATKSVTTDKCFFLRGLFFVLMVLE